MEAALWCCGLLIPTEASACSVMGAFPVGCGNITANWSSTLRYVLASPQFRLDWGRGEVPAAIPTFQARVELHCLKRPRGSLGPCGCHMLA